MTTNYGGVCMLRQTSSFDEISTEAGILLGGNGCACLNINQEFSRVIRRKMGSKSEGQTSLLHTARARTPPNPKTSARSVGAEPASTSGAIVSAPGVPRPPAIDATVAARDARACWSWLRSKSASTARRGPTGTQREAAVSRTLAGLTSQWTTPCRCTCSNPHKTSSAMTRPAATPAAAAASSVPSHRSMSVGNQGNCTNTRSLDWEASAPVLASLG